MARTIHPFPARMAPDIAIAKLEGHPSNAHLRVLDPMCGSGTVLAAAAERGHSSYGYDMDPLAVLMSRVATQPVDLDQLASEAGRVLDDARHDTSDERLWADQETSDFADYWFGASQQTQLTRLARAISHLRQRESREALQIALSRLIVTKAPRASLAADTSHSRPHKVTAESEFDVYRGFERSVAQLTGLLAKRVITGTSEVALGDARRLDLPDASIDLVITSPPYLNAIDYLRGHRMSLIWLGHSVRELRGIRGESIGTERALKVPDAEITRMVDEVRSRVALPEVLPAAMIARYAQDLTRFSSELRRVCRPGAEVVTVVGNSTLRGNYIENDLLVRRALVNVGFTVTRRVERELPENRRYLPVSARSQGSERLGKRMRAEIVVTAVAA